MLFPQTCFVLILGRPPRLAAVSRLRCLLARWPGSEVVVVGHGDAADLAAPLRALAGSDARIRAVLHARRASPDTALRVAVQAARAPWILRLPEDAGSDAEEAAVDLLLQHPDRVLGSRDGLMVGDGGPILFKQRAFQLLPRIPAMSRMLAELLDRHGLGLRRLGPADPGHRRVARTLRRAYVALACTMGLWWTPSRRTA